MGNSLPCCKSPESSNDVMVDSVPSMVPGTSGKFSDMPTPIPVFPQPECVPKPVESAPAKQQDKEFQAEFRPAEESESDESPEKKAPINPTASAVKVDVVFVADGREVSISFNRKPLGMKFTNKDLPGSRALKPVFVSDVSATGNAMELGVQVGWQIKSVAGRSCQEQIFEDTKAFFKELTMALPDK